MAAEEPAASAAGQTEQASQQWSVSLLGSLQLCGTESSGRQVDWPWFFFKALFCPALALGANETLFQEEEPADVGCLQPHAQCGPTCRSLRPHTWHPRGLNEQLCGLGNEGLRLACLGLPLVAWLTSLQRQRVAAKHDVQHADECELGAAALYPCALAQVHALMQQQRQPAMTGAAFPAPYVAPRVQHMAANAVEPLPAPSTTGPLTSAISASRVLRAVHTLSGAPTARTAAASRLGDSMDSSSSSSGVVDMPGSCAPPDDDETESMPKQARGAMQTGQPAACELAACAPAEQPQQQEPLPLRSEQQLRSSLEPGQRPASRQLGASRGGPLHACRPTRVSASPCPRDGGSTRPASRGGGGGGLSAGGNKSAAVDEVQGPLAARRLAGRHGANARTTECDLPPLTDGAVTAPLQQHMSECARTVRTTTCSKGGATDNNRLLEGAPCAAADSEAAAPTAAEQQGEAQGAAVHVPGDVAVSCGRLSLARSVGRLLLSFSQEDVPLMALRPSPARTSRASGNGLPGGSRLRGSGAVGTSSDVQQQAVSPDASGYEQQQLLVVATAVGVAQETDGGSAHEASRPAIPGDEGAATVIVEKLASVQQQHGKKQQQQQQERQQQQEHERQQVIECVLPPPQSEDSSLVCLKSPPHCSGDSSSGQASTPQQRGAARGSSRSIRRGHKPANNWAYASDLCCLGGSFELAAGASVAMRTLGRVVEAEEGSEPDSNAPGDGRPAVHMKQQHQRATTTGQQPALAGAPRTATVDAQLIAAVAGTSDPQTLTASQRELAERLARLALANPSAARQLAAAQKCGDGSSSAAAAVEAVGAAAVAARGAVETFYPTMMSDVCNLGDPWQESLVNPSGAAATGDLSQKQQQQQNRASAAHPASRATALASDGSLGCVSQRMPAGAAAPRTCSVRFGDVSGSSSAGPLRAAMLHRAAAGGGGGGSAVPQQQAHSGQQAPCDDAHFDSYFPDCSLNLPDADDARCDARCEPPALVTNPLALSVGAAGGVGGGAAAGGGAAGVTGVGGSPPKRVQAEPLACESAADEAALSHTGAISDVSRGWACDANCGRVAGGAASPEPAAAMPRKGSGSWPAVLVAGSSVDAA